MYVETRRAISLFRNNRYRYNSIAFSFVNNLPDFRPITLIFIIPTYCQNIHLKTPKRMARSNVEAEECRFGKCEGL